MPIFYTGIGSRELPAEVFARLRKIGKALAEKGYTLRSGGAAGADTAFEEGCLEAGGSKEIYLPWKDFNGRVTNKEGYIYMRSHDYAAYKRAKEIAARLHPVWDKLGDSAKMMHSRNIHQVLGLDVATPSAFVVCWTQAPAGFGGTSQALRCAAENAVKVFNLAAEDKLMEFRDFFKTLPQIPAQDSSLTSHSQ